jgi:hypothetical protein
MHKLKKIPREQKISGEFREKNPITYFLILNFREYIREEEIFFIFARI